jgi:hypothetical protein
VGRAVFPAGEGVNKQGLRGFVFPQTRSRAADARSPSPEASSRRREPYLCPLRARGPNAGLQRASSLPQRDLAAAGLAGSPPRYAWRCGDEEARGALDPVVVSLLVSVGVSSSSPP